MLYKFIKKYLWYIPDIANFYTAQFYPLICPHSGINFICNTFTPHIKGSTCTTKLLLTHWVCYNFQSVQQLPNGMWYNFPSVCCNNIYILEIPQLLYMGIQFVKLFCNCLYDLFNDIIIYYMI